MEFGKILNSTVAKAFIRQFLWIPRVQIFKLSKCNKQG
jgi:hypothetical protein